MEMKIDFEIACIEKEIRVMEETLFQRWRLLHTLLVERRELNELKNRNLGDNSGGAREKDS